MTLRKREVDEGTLLALAAGRTAWSERFSPDRSFVEEPLPAVRSRRGGALLPRPARRNRRRGLAAQRTVPSGRTSAPSSSSASRTRNWNADHAPRRDSNIR